ncbi:hypothetical protein JTE90_022649 [Oedothorax gibbosus]|uniref:Nudix hydrolase domain-containing protein n=1 Tax=Oedothorax gibbosus TaxID=931172 RepID=A0AAV6TU73_9ARAC|nr:hypothetical protein JTE90_022649 [Oedothorax gibbosus]
MPVYHQKSHKFDTSYGIVVKTTLNQVVILFRKVPYCVQNFLVQMKKETPPCPFWNFRNQFETSVLPHLKRYEKLDYRRFINNSWFEDMYDFPHGQLHTKCKNVSLERIFLSAYREFTEESGFHFKFKKEDIKHYPLVELEFKGHDGIRYWQYYFIVENVPNLKRHSYFNSFDGCPINDNQIRSWIDDRLVFHGQLLNLQVAYDLFLRQHTMKQDWKHLLCLPTAQLLENVRPAIKVYKTSFEWYNQCTTKEEKEATKDRDLNNN